MIAADTAIELAQVVKRFPTSTGDLHALGPVDLAIRDGEFVSVVGASGCGKSTLMLVAAGLIPPTDGTITVNGKPLSSALTEVGIVFQDDLLLDFRTTIDNILLQAQVRNLPKKASTVRARELLAQLGLEAAADRYPSQLSGGMRQRASLGRALLHDPPILLMDEPFGALDAITRTQMRHDLEELWLRETKTVLFITHSVEEAVGLSDRVIVMSPAPGRIVEQIEIDLPRPRPVEIGNETAFVEYADRIYDIFRKQGVLRF